jgi:hypothetical protein
VGFSIREALRECDNAARRLELADSASTVREAFLVGFNRIERVLRYTAFAWVYLECGHRWKPVFEQVVSSAMTSYPGPERLSFGHLHVLFTKLPATFADSDQASGENLFATVARAQKKAKVNEKLSNLVYWRNGVGHEKEYVTSLSVPQLRQKCWSALTEARAALAELDSRRLLPLTVRPEVEHRYRNQRVLSLLDPDDAAIEAYVGSETDLTEPLIYFASGNNGRRDPHPRFLRAAIVEALSGLTGQDSGPGRA